MRGRLICKFQADIRRLDADAVRDQDDGHGRSAMNDVFRELAKTKDPGGGAIGTNSRIEMDPLIIPCQVEPLSWRETKMTPDGDDPTSMVKLVFHRKTLENMGLIDSQGLPKLRKGDRLAHIFDKAGDASQSFTGTTKEVFLDSIKNDSFGLNMLDPKANLLVAIFKPKPKGVNA